MSASRQIVASLIGAAVAAFPLVSSSEDTRNPTASLVILLDLSASMKGDGRLPAAKRGALAAARETLESGGEVAVLGFRGSCQQPIAQRLTFTRDLGKIRRFIDGLRARGGTALAPAVIEAQRAAQRGAGRHGRIVVVLGDGKGGCPNFADNIGKMRATGVQTETIALGVAKDSPGYRQLERIAKASRGGFHHAKSANDLAHVFSNVMETLQMSELVGNLGEASPPPKTKPKSDESRLEDILGDLDD